jgi:hypothetical protein
MTLTLIVPIPYRMLQSDVRVNVLAGGVGSSPDWWSLPADDACTSRSRRTSLKA